MENPSKWGGILIADYLLKGPICRLLPVNFNISVTSDRVEKFAWGDVPRKTTKSGFTL